MADLFNEDSSSSSSSDDDNLGGGANDQLQMAFIPQKPPQDEVFEMGVKNMNDFLDQINKFEKITNNTLSDLWKIKDTAFQPLKVHIDIQEYMPGLFDLLKPNKDIEISKVMSVFCFLQIETHNLKHEIESKFFDPLILFGESGLVYETITDEELAGNQEIQMSRMLAIYRDFFETIKKIVALTKNVIYQMNGLFSEKAKLYKNTFKKVIYYEIFNNLGSILSTLYIVDVIIAENTNFQSYWEQYTKMFLIVKNDPAKFNFTSKKLKKLHKFCQKMYSNILCGKLYTNYLDQLCKVILSEIEKESPFKNKEFAAKYLEFIKYKIDSVTELLSKAGDINSHTEFMNLLINYSIYRKLFGNEESSIYKKIWSLQKLCPIIILYNNLQINAGTFLVNVCPLKKKATCDPKDINAFQKECALKKSEQFSPIINQLYMKLINWVVRMNSDSLHDTQQMLRDKEFLKTRSNLIITGVMLGIEIKRHLKSLILMFQANGFQLPPQRLTDIVQAIEMLKAIEIEFKTKKFIINQWVVLINRFISEEINKLIEKGMANLFKMKKGIIQDDMLYLMTTIIECHKGGYNMMRKTVIRHCMNLMNKEIFTQQELKDLEYLGWKLDIIANWEWFVRKSTRCRFLFWTRSLIPTLFQLIMQDKHKLNQINYFLMALTDPIDMLVNIKHLEHAQVAIDNYKKEIYQAFTKEVVKPVCRKIEDELRLQIHHVIISNLKQRNPLRERIEDCVKYTKMNDIYLFEKRINMAEEVKHYLDQKFYEMTALSPHDWKTYEHMRILAKEKFQITVMPSHLPAQTLEQGVDILYLLRNLQSYVTKYHYNLHTQMFIETTKETKQIKTISVNQMLYSIKTHGVGILGTAINTFYKFLIKKFGIFSEFLYDDFIHNPLLQEQRYFNTNKEKLNGQYPYERAEKISKAIKRLGTVKGGLTFIDKFRLLITQFGNALGFVRMIRNASLKDNSNLIKFIPKIMDTIVFEDVAKELGIKGETMEAAKMFDMSIRLLFRQAEDANDYLRILVQNFEGVFNNEDCAHLKLFYIIIPPVILNYIDNLTNAKAKITKKNNKDAFLSDDGFPLGIAYLLKILDQTDTFSSLNWFESMKEKYRRDQDNANQRSTRIGTNMTAAGRVIEEENDDERMSKERINKISKEFDLLNYCFSASLILFKEI